MGQMMCGVTVTLGGQSGLVAQLTGFSGLGADRVVVADISGASIAAGWVDQLHSCLVTAKPLTLNIAFEANYRWDLAIAAGKNTLTMTFPIATGKTTGATAVAQAVISSFEATGTIQDRMTATIVVAISGAWVVTAGANA